jgi:hypothetical protein
MAAAQQQQAWRVAATSKQAYDRRSKQGRSIQHKASSWLNTWTTHKGRPWGGGHGSLAGCILATGVSKGKPMYSWQRVGGVKYTIPSHPIYSGYGTITSAIIVVSIKHHLPTHAPMSPPYNKPIVLMRHSEYAENDRHSCTCQAPRCATEFSSRCSNTAAMHVPSDRAIPLARSPVRIHVIIQQSCASEST